MMNDGQIWLREIGHRARNPTWIASLGLRLVRESSARLIPSEFNRLFTRVKPLTMVSYARLQGLHRATAFVVKNKVKGDFVECGVARGGSAAMIGLSMEQLGAKRDLWLFDTFQGLPRPTEDDPDYHIADRYTGTCVGSIEDVSNALRGLGLGEGLHLVPGLFQDTLPAAPISSIALLHVDGDWYESVKVCLENLYDKVSPGGVIQFDDYGHWAGARKAVDEFIAKRGIRTDLHKLDFAGRQLVKALDY